MKRFKAFFFPKMITTRKKISTCNKVVPIGLINLKKSDRIDSWLGIELGLWMFVVEHWGQKTCQYTGGEEWSIFFSHAKVPHLNGLGS